MNLAPNLSLNYMVLASKKTLLKEVESMDAWMQAFEDRHNKDAFNADGDIEIEDEEPEFKRKQNQKTKDPIQAFVNRL